MNFIKQFLHYLMNFNQILVVFVTFQTSFLIISSVLWTLQGFFGCFLKFSRYYGISIIKNSSNDNKSDQNIPFFDVFWKKISFFNDSNDHSNLSTTAISIQSPPQLLDLHPSRPFNNQTQPRLHLPYELPKPHQNHPSITPKWRTDQLLPSPRPICTTNTRLALISRLRIYPRSPRT